MGRRRGARHTTGRGKTTFVPTFMQPHHAMHAMRLQPACLAHPAPPHHAPNAGGTNPTRYLWEGSRIERRVTGWNLRAKFKGSSDELEGG